jgi:hypothetical protein
LQTEGKKRKVIKELLSCEPCIAQSNQAISPPHKIIYPIPHANIGSTTFLESKQTG